MPCRPSYRSGSLSSVPVFRWEDGVDRNPRRLGQGHPDFLQFQKPGKTLRGEDVVAVDPELSTNATRIFIHGRYSTRKVQKAASPTEDCLLREPHDPVLPNELVQGRCLRLGEAHG